jgi:hypothetical protein
VDSTSASTGKFVEMGGVTPNVYVDRCCMRGEKTNIMKFHPFPRLFTTFYPFREPIRHTLPCFITNSPKQQ